MKLHPVVIAYVQFGKFMLMIQLQTKAFVCYKRNVKNNQVFVFIFAAIIYELLSLTKEVNKF